MIQVQLEIPCACQGGADPDTLYVSVCQSSRLQLKKKKEKEKEKGGTSCVHFYLGTFLSEGPTQLNLLNPVQRLFRMCLLFTGV